MDDAIERRAAHELRVLLRSPDPLVQAAMKLARLRAALIAARDTGPDVDLPRPSGECLCSVCGDPYIDHPTVVDEPYLNHLCTGERVKL